MRGTAEAVGGALRIRGRVYGSSVTSMLDPFLNTMQPVTSIAVVQSATLKFSVVSAGVVALGTRRLRTGECNGRSTAAGFSCSAQNLCIRASALFIRRSIWQNKQTLEQSPNIRLSSYA